MNEKIYNNLFQLIIEARAHIISNNSKIVCCKTGQPCSWESVDISTGDDYNWDLQCQDCYRWRDWSKDE